MDEPKSTDVCCSFPEYPKCTQHGEGKECLIPNSTCALRKYVAPEEVKSTDADQLKEYCTADVKTTEALIKKRDDRVAHWVKRICDAALNGGADDHEDILSIANQIVSLENSLDGERRFLMSIPIFLNHDPAYTIGIFDKVTDEIDFFDPLPVSYFLEHKARMGPAFVVLETEMKDGEKYITKARLTEISIIT